MLVEDHYSYNKKVIPDTSNRFNIVCAYANIEVDRYKTIVVLTAETDNINNI